MKKLLLFFFFVSLIGSAKMEAQKIRIPNSSFETWDNLQGLIDVPDSWPSSDLIWFSQGYNTHNVYRDRHSHSGTYSARIGTDTAHKKIWPGFIAAKFAVNQRVKYFSFYFVDSINKAESGVVQVSLFKGSTISQDSIGGGVWNFPDSVISNFNFAEIPLTYSGADTTIMPDSISVTFEVVSAPTSLESGHVVIDDVALSVKKLAKLDTPGPESEFRIFPNPSSGLIHVETFYQAINKSNIIISDINGKVIYPSYFINQNQTTIDFSGYATGVYLLKLLSGDKILVNKVMICR